MYTTYIVYSPSRDRYYIGFTSDELTERIKKHNTNHKGFTGKTGDWILRYKEIFPSKEEAQQREKEIKAWKSRILIEKLIRSVGATHSD
jgi:putative endonuclease